jgi:hypothetical protein
VLSLSRITLEYNEKIRPEPDRENAFAGASGGGNVINTELSPVSMAFLSGALSDIRPSPKLIDDT